MNKILSIVCVIALFSCTNKDAHDHEQAEATSTEQSSEQVKLVGNFGEEITAEGVKSIEDLVAQLESNDSVSMKVSSEILKTCAKKGCWMNVVLNDEEHMRVTFKDYGFFVPKQGVEGKIAVLDGFARKVTTDVETLKHFAEDAGKSQEEIDAITETKEEITFVASGVIIK